MVTKKTRGNRCMHGADQWIEGAEVKYVPFRGFVLMYQDYIITLNGGGFMRATDRLGNHTDHYCNKTAYEKLKAKLDEIDLVAIARV